MLYNVGDKVKHFKVPSLIGFVETVYEEKKRYTVKWTEGGSTGFGGMSLSGYTDGELIPIGSLEDWFEHVI